MLNKQRPNLEETGDAIFGHVYIQTSCVTLTLPLQNALNVCLSVGQKYFGIELDRGQNGLFLSLPP